MKWIKIKEREPEKCGRYLLFIQGCKCSEVLGNQEQVKYIYIASWNGFAFTPEKGLDLWLTPVYQTHWAELPEYPE